MRKIINYCLILFISLIMVSCGENEVATPKKELLIYCGITMIKPMMEIKTIIEKKHNCSILITKGGSGNLLKSLKVNKIGDLYLPGSDSYIKKGQEDNIITDTVFVGYNKATLMVQKGNPKNITADLNNLIKKDLLVVLGNPDSGSIGKETKKILSSKGIFDEAMQNVSILTTDSKKLFQVLKEKQADLVINWFAISTWEGQKEFVTAIPINEEFAKKKKLVIGLLKSSRFPTIAKDFMEFAESAKGKAIFKKYGLGE